MLSRLFGCLLFLLLAGGIARAQKTGPPTQPKIPVAPAAIAPAAPVATTPLPAQGQDMVRMQYPNTDVKDILAVYERLTGKKIVFDNTVQGPVNIVISREVPREEAIKIIEINLLLNGFAFVPDENNIVKVTGIGRNPRSTGVPVYSDIDQLPEGDRVVSFLFKLKYADPVELQATLGTYIAPAPTGYTSMVALPKAQSLLVTENTAVLRTLIQIIAQIDVAPADVVTEFIQLERADAKEVLEKLEKIFEKSPSSGTTTAVRAVPPPVPGQPPGVAAGSVSVDINTGGPSEESLITGRIKLSADVRTNRILVVTRPTNLPFVKKLVKEFDSDIKFAEPKIRNLKYVLAGDVLPVIVKAITEPGMKADDAGGQGAAGAQGQRPGNATGAVGGIGGGGGRNGSNAGGLGGSSSGSSLSVSEELQTQPAETTPQAVTIGTTKIIADRRANTIIVLGNEDVTNKVFKVLDEMDVRAPQVVLNTVIGELRLSKDEEFGVDILKFLKLYGGSSIGTSGTGSTTGGTTTGDPLSGLTSTAGFLAARGISVAATGGLSQYAIATKNFAGTVKALEATGRFRITQRPMVFASNNKKAIIASGEEIAVPGQTLSSLNNGNNGFNQNASVASTVQFRQVALQLEVVPLINSDREVSLDILQKIDDLSGQNDVVGGNSIPRINTRYIRTNVSIANGETVVLGGLIKKRNERSTSGPTLISRVPLVGYFFRTTNKTEERSELIILIRPVVTIMPRETLDASEREQERLFIPPDLESTLDPPNARIKTGRPATVKPVAPKPVLRSGK